MSGAPTSTSRVRRAGSDASGRSAATTRECGRGGDLDVARLRLRARSRGGACPQRRQIGLERAHHALAVLRLETRERLDVGEQRVAASGQLDDLLFEPAAFGLAPAARLRPRTRPRAGATTSRPRRPSGATSRSPRRPLRRRRAARAATCDAGCPRSRGCRPTRSAPRSADPAAASRAGSRPRSPPRPARGGH